MRLVASILGLTLAAGAASAAEPEKSPVRRLGKTVVEWKDGTVQVVVSYRSANGVFGKERWLFLETAVSAMSGQPVTVNREDVSLQLPDGTVVPMPSQKTMAEDNKDVVRQFEMSKATREPVTGYFVTADREERLGFFAVPGEAIVFQEFSVNFRRVAIGDLYFTTPTGIWKPGTYTLLIRNKVIDVKLPFDLPAGDVPKKTGDKTVPW